MTLALPEVRPEIPAEPVYPELLKVAETLREAGWSQGDYAVYDAEGDGLVGLCLMGGFFVSRYGATPDDLDDDDALGERRAATHAAAKKFSQRLGFSEPADLADWNDEDGRTFDEVVERLERAAYGL